MNPFFKIIVTYKRSHSAKSNGNPCHQPKMPSTIAPTENHYQKVVEQAASTLYLSNRYSPPFKPTGVMGDPWRKNVGMKNRLFCFTTEIEGVSG